MPSNEELIKLIGESVEALGIDAPDTASQNNAELAETLKTLKKLDPKAEKAERLKAAAAANKTPVKAKKKSPYTLKQGKSLTTLRGIRSDGDDITPDDLMGGQKALDEFVKSGHVVKS